MRARKIVMTRLRSGWIVQGLMSKVKPARARSRCYNANPGVRDSKVVAGIWGLGFRIEDAPGLDALMRARSVVMAWLWPGAVSITITRILPYSGSDASDGSSACAHPHSNNSDRHAYKSLMRLTAGVHAQLHKKFVFKVRHHFDDDHPYLTVLRV